MSSNQHGRLSSDGDSGAVAGDLRGVVDKVLGDVCVVALGDVVLDVDEVGEVIEDGELFAVGGVGLGGRGAAEGVVGGVVIMMVPSDAEWGGEAEEGESEEDGEES